MVGQIKKTVTNKTASEMYKNHLADKRTVLAYLRTGLALLMVPMSMITVLIATSSHYSIENVLAMFSTMIVLCCALICAGVFMVGRSFWQLSAVNCRLKDLEKTYDYLDRWNEDVPA